MGAPARAGFAQQGDMNLLMSRLGQLENQVQTLSRSVYRDDATAPPVFSGGDDASAAAVAGFETRMSGIEQQQRQLTGQIEEAAHLARQLQDRLDRMQNDMETRLQRLEGGGMAVSPAPQQAAPFPPAAEVQMNTGTVGTLGTLSSSSISAAADTPETLYEAAFSDIRAAKYAEADAGFSRFLALHPGHRLAANAQYWLGETHYVRGDYSAAARVFAQGYQDYPKGAKAADSLFKLGQSLAGLGRKDDACLSFAQLKKEFPQGNIPAYKLAAQESLKLGCAG